MTPFIIRNYDCLDLNSFLFEQVYHSAWTELCDGMASATTLDEVMEVHEAYLSSIQRQCFVASDKLVRTCHSYKKQRQSQSSELLLRVFIFRVFSVGSDRQSSQDYTRIGARLPQCGANSWHRRDRRIC